MLKTVEGIINPDGGFQLKKPVKVKKPKPVLITLLDEKMEESQEENDIAEKQRQACLKLSGIFDSGLTDISENIDKYLYE